MSAERAAAIARVIGETAIFSDLKARWRWRPIPNCPGRLVFAAGLSNVAPADLVSCQVPVTEHRVAAATDLIIVAAFADGGLISYRKQDGTYLHTLNSREGFARKLQQLGIDLS